MVAHRAPGSVSPSHHATGPNARTLTLKDHTCWRTWGFAGNPKPSLPRSPFSLHAPSLYSRYESVKISWQYLDGKALSVTALVILGHYVTAETMLWVFCITSMAQITSSVHYLSTPATRPGNGRMQSHGEKITTRSNDHILAALIRGKSYHFFPSPEPVQVPASPSIIGHGSNTRRYAMRFRLCPPRPADAFSISLGVRHI